MSAVEGPKQPDKASSNDLDNNAINDKIKDVYGPANNNKNKNNIRFGPETIEVKISLSEKVYQVARLVCQIEYDLDWDQYVSALVRQDAHSLKGGDRNILKDYA